MFSEKQVELSAYGKTLAIQAFYNYGAVCPARRLRSAGIYYWASSQRTASEISQWQRVAIIIVLTLRPMSFNQADYPSLYRLR